MTRQELETHILQLNVFRKEILLQRIRPAIEVHTSVLAEDDCPLGTSRFGGWPDLPEGVEWPHCAELSATDYPYTNSVERTGGPFYFLAQINLSEMTQFDREKLLPESGMLYFFCALHLDGFPRVPGNNRWQVLYYDGPHSALHRVPLPNLNADMQDAVSMSSVVPEYCSPPCHLTFSLQAMLSYSELLDEGFSTLEYQELWETLYSHFQGERYSANHLLGFAQELQADMRETCERWFPDSPLHFLPQTPEDWQRWREIKSNKPRLLRQWTLLFQIDTQPDIALHWEAWGRGYFWIRKEDLLARRFDRVCLVNQHT